MKIYCVSGLGANHQVFKYLKLPPRFELVPIPWLVPEKQENLDHYVQRMMEPIRHNEDFILMGLSFGGIIVQEMNRTIQPKHNFLISTIKNRQELPNLLKFASNSKIYKAIPVQFFTNDTIISYSFFRKLYDSRMPKLDEFFAYKDPAYLSWSIHNVLQWRESQNIENYTHIHGDKDLVFPIKKIQNIKRIQGGTHLMVMQKPREVSYEINLQLKQMFPELS